MAGQGGMTLPACCFAALLPRGDKSGDRLRSHELLPVAGDSATHYGSAPRAPDHERPVAFFERWALGEYVIV